MSWGLKCTSWDPTWPFLGPKMAIGDCKLIARCSKLAIFGPNLVILSANIVRLSPNLAILSPNLPY